MNNFFAKKYISTYLIYTLIIIIIIVKLFFFDIITIVGDSMFDTYKNCDIVIIKKQVEDINLYDVVVVKINGETYIKRVVGLQDDLLIYDDGYIKRNGLVMDRFNSFTNSEYYGILKNEILVEEDFIFIIGDNRSNSYDSRNFDTIDISNVVGIVMDK